MRQSRVSLCGRSLALVGLFLGLSLTRGAEPNRERIGVGFITNQEGPHLSQYRNALAEIAEIGAIYLVDPDGTVLPEVRSELKDKLAGVYGSTAQLFAAQKPDVVLIALEPRLAVPAVAEALDAGCHVIVEKPAFLEVDVLAGLVRKAEARGLHIMLALANRTTPEYRLAHDLIEQRQLGKIYGMELHLIADQARLRNPAYRQSWLAQKARSGGGHLAWLGIHWLDLATYITGSDIVEVAGFTANVGGQPIEVEDSAVMSLRFGDGFLGTMTSGYYLGSGYHSHLKVWGEMGWLEINLYGGETPMRYVTKDHPEVRHFVSPETGESAYTRFIGACIRAIIEQRDPPVSNRDTWQIVRTIRAAYDAAETSQSQRIKTGGE